MTIAYTSAATLARRIRSGEISPVAVLDALFDRIDAHDDEVNAFVHRCEEDAYDAAREAERAVEEGRALGPLHGVPVAIKDLDTPVEGAPMTCGSVPLADVIAPEDCLLVERLRDAGAIPIGMTNVPEFGHKGVTDNPLHGTTVTPFDTDRIAGGSSGGSAAAVAAGLAPLATGSDAGGSIRIPSSACGVVGLMPSFGLVPFDARPDALEPHTPFTALGPIARTVEDVALMLEVIAGWHPDDPFSVPDPGEDYVEAAQCGADDLSIQYSRDLGIFPVEDAVTDATDGAVEALESAGASVTRADPDFGHDYETTLDAWEEGFKVLLSSLPDKVERATGIDLLEDHRESLSPKFVEYIDAGLAQRTTEFKLPDMVRTDVYDAVNDVLADHDVLATPTLAVPPFDADGTGPSEIDGVPIDDPYFGWPMTWVFNLTGHPVLSVPAGFTDDGLPVGIQLVGQRFDDATVLAVGATLERLQPWHTEYPPAGLDDNTPTEVADD